MPAVPLLLVGLGNPGPRYRDHRHNIGAMAVDAIADRYGLRPWRRRFAGEAADGVIADRKVVALKPLTYMNESGRAVAAAVHFYRLAPADVVVFHDELDLAAGKLRVKSGGGHAGHNGLRSIHAHIGADYRRVRLGIGRPADSDDVVAWVLSDFAKADAAWLGLLLDAVAEHAGLLIAGDDAAFMSKVALATATARAAAVPGTASSG